MDIPRLLLLNKFEVSLFTAVHKYRQVNLYIRLIKPLSTRRQCRWSDLLCKNSSLKQTEAIVHIIPMMHCRVPMLP